MTQRNLIVGGLFGFATCLALAACTAPSQSTDAGPLPPVSAGMPTIEAGEISGQADLVDVDSIDRLILDEPRVYYQYTDESGAVRFVQSLLEVPEAWRDRAGRVELAAPPPTSPAEARMLRKLGEPQG